MPPHTPEQLLATVLFALAVIHTFSVKIFAKWASKHPEGSVKENLLHFLAEAEVVFGLWAAALFAGLAALSGSIPNAIEHIEKLNFTEPKFVFVVMVVAATRPVVKLAECMISAAARLLPLNPSTAFYLSALVLGPLLGSFITEPAAMTLLAMVLKRRYFDNGMRPLLAYATLGLLFVNVSIGGTMTHFAAPPVLMVAAKWDWDMAYMFTHFGWRAAASCLVSTLLVALVFRHQLAAIPVDKGDGEKVPALLTLIHLAFLGLVVGFAHHPDIFFGVFMLFLGLVVATREYQEELKIREALLVGFFLAGLVVLGSLQNWWLQPLIVSLDPQSLFYGSIGLTAITDNAAITYLGAAAGITDELQRYALVAGAVTGGGLTIIANAPNPAGAGILNSSKAFGSYGINPLGLLLGALVPTGIAICFFWVFYSLGY